jgi:hypothetical protein
MMDVPESQVISGPSQNIRDAGLPSGIPKASRQRPAKLVWFWVKRCVRISKKSGAFLCGAHERLKRFK